MIRISGVIMPQRKHIYIALQDIYGIGKTRAVNICKRANIKTSIRVIDIASEKIINIQNIVNSYKIEGELIIFHLFQSPRDVFSASTRHQTRLLFVF